MTLAKSRALGFALVTMSLLSSCATPPPAAAVAAQRQPAIDANFPDPSTLRARDGYTYVYATQGGGTQAAPHNIQMARSRDLHNWEMLGDALPTKPVWASATQDFWAPAVHYAEGRYFLYYSAKPDAALTDTTRGLCLAVAVAERPTGPFVDSGAPLLCGESFVNIDPFAYDDPATGKRLLYWGSGFGPIKVRELAADRISFAPGSAAIDLIPVIPDTDPNNYSRLIEGAWLERRDGYYYLFYSGDNCCGENAHYAVMVARSRSATGPFETLAQAGGRADSVILEASPRWLAPGHNAVATDARGQSWILYHAIDRARDRALPSDGVNSRRVMLVDRLDWVDGWPVVRGAAR